MGHGRRVIGLSAAMLTSSAMAQVDGGTEAADAGVTDGVPEVSGREDFMNLSREEQRTFLIAKRPAVSFTYGGSFRYSGEADFDESSGSISRGRAGGEFGPAFRLSDTGTFALRFSGEYSFYEFDGRSGIVAGQPLLEEPFEDAAIYTIAPAYRYDDGEWVAIVAGQFTSAGEPGADFEDTLIYGGFAGLQYTVNDRLKIGLGVAASTDLEDGPVVIPLPLIEWGITDTLTLRGGQNVQGIELARSIDERKHWEVAVFASFERRRFRLDDDGPIPGGIVTDTAVPVGLSLTYQPSPGTIFRVFGGVDVWGEVDFDDRDGDDLTERQIEPAPAVGLNLRLSF